MIGTAWIILGIILLVAEVFTSGFVLMWFGIGAIAAGLLALLGVTNLAIQAIVFLVISAVLTIASRTIFEQFFLRFSPGKGLKTGADSLPGQVGVVVASSVGAMKEGAVKVFGSTWKALPAEGETELAEGEQVRVERVEGVTIFVRRVEESPSWRDEPNTDQ